MVGIKKKDKLTPEQLEEMNEYMEKLLEENQVLGERCKDFLDNVRKNLFAWSSNVFALLGGVSCEPTAVACDNQVGLNIRIPKSG